MPEGNPYDPDWTEEGSDDSFGEQEPTDEDLDAIESDENEEFGQSMEELLSHFEAEQDEFNEAEQEFIDKFGFVHKCRCAQDWADGNLSVVSICYLGMVADAMDTLETKIKELKDAKREIARLRIDG